MTAATAAQIAYITDLQAAARDARRNRTMMTRSEWFKLNRRRATTDPAAWKYALETVSEIDPRPLTTIIAMREHGDLLDQINAASGRARRRERRTAHFLYLRALWEAYNSAEGPAYLSIDPTTLTKAEASALIDLLK